jgi:hypothetical protein
VTPSRKGLGVLSVTPCSAGLKPVKMLVWDGFVRGIGLAAFSKRTPSSARRSTLGVRAVPLP